MLCSMIILDNHSCTPLGGGLKHYSIEPCSLGKSSHLIQIVLFIGLEVPADQLHKHHNKSMKRFVLIKKYHAM